MTPIVLVAGGSEECPHRDTQLIEYRSPTVRCSVWTCPTCHRIVRQDVPVEAGDWTEPRVHVPVGLEGARIPGTNRRGWLMPEPEPATRRRFGPAARG